MNKSAGQHYIPQGILRNFCFNGDSLYYYSKRSPAKGVHRRNVASVFKKRHINTFWTAGGRADDGLERFFSKHFDDRIANLIRYITERILIDNSVNISEYNRLFLVQFLYNHMKRTPDFHDNILKKVDFEGCLQRAVEASKAKGRDVSEHEIARLREHSKKTKILHNIRVQGISRQSTNVLDVMANLPVVFGVPARANKQFIVASNPVARLVNWPGSILSDGGTELWCTLSPRLAFGLAPKYREMDIVLIDACEIRRLNKILANQSNSIASSNKDLLESIADPK